MINAVALCVLLTAPGTAPAEAAPAVRSFVENGVAAQPHGPEDPPAIPARVTAASSHARLSARHERPVATVATACRLVVLLVEADHYRAPFLTPRSPEETPSSQRDPPLSTR